MTIWWCETHDEGFSDRDHPDPSWCYVGDLLGDTKRCRMAQRELSPEIGESSKMMSDRESLTKWIRDWDNTAETRTWAWTEVVEFIDLLVPAARKHLAQLPETCEHCGGDGLEASPGLPLCPMCHGSGKDYRAETTDPIADVLHASGFTVLRETSRRLAVAVLDTLNAEPES